MVALRATIPGKTTLEERLFYCQNWRHDVVMLLNTSAGRAEGVRYSAYGVPFGIPRADVTGDGTVGLADSNVITIAFGAGIGDPGYNIRADINLDGEVDLGDYDIMAIDFGAALGRGSLSSYTTSGSGGVRNRIGYAGYQFDDAAAKYHVRNRVYDAVSGRWLRRDPLGYVDGPSLYEYIHSSPQLATALTSRLLECNEQLGGLEGCSGIEEFGKGKSCAKCIIKINRLLSNECNKDCCRYSCGLKWDRCSGDNHRCYHCKFGCDQCCTKDFAENCLKELLKALPDCIKCIYDPRVRLGTEGIFVADINEELFTHAHDIFSPLLSERKKKKCKENEKKNPGVYSFCHHYAPPGQENIWPECRPGAICETNYDCANPNYDP